jgi:hypothetical protein
MMAVVIIGPTRYLVPFGEKVEARFSQARGREIAKLCFCVVAQRRGHIVEAEAVVAEGLEQLRGFVTEAGYVWRVHLDNQGAQRGPVQSKLKLYGFSCVTLPLIGSAGASARTPD